MLHKNRSYGKTNNTKNISVKTVFKLTITRWPTIELFEESVFDTLVPNIAAGQARIVPHIPEV